MHIEQKPSTNLQTQLGWQQQPSATISHHSNQDATHHEDSRKVKASKSIRISIVSKLDFNFLVNPFLYKKDKTIQNSTQVEVDSFNFTILLTSSWRIVVRVSSIVSRPLILWMPSPKGFNPYKFLRKGPRIRSNMLFDLQCWKQMLHNHCKINECSSCCTLKVI
jgi:hypothetical protein